ncbi:MAG: putative biosynthesis protein WbpG [Bacteroidota bacterium]|jgi:N-acetyl sugar amidotransferase
MNSSKDNYHEIQRCTTCVLDTTVNDIWFDENGECKYCKIHRQQELQHPLGLEMEKYLAHKIEEIKQYGKGKPYDCVVGVSGGRDSTYTLLTAVKLGLRPLAVHFDNGWNTEISVNNIKKACSKLNVELHTIVADWEEFREIQKAFLKSSTPDADIPTDYAIYSVLYHTANKENIKYILNGHSFRTEGTSPISWTYMDPIYVNDVMRKYSKVKKITSFPHMSLMKLQYYLWIKKIREFRILEYIEYNKKEVDRILESELDWQYYGGHHHENHYTKFFQSYYLPVKFNIDKRKTEYSALIRSGQMKRDQVLNILGAGNYEYDSQTIKYALNKLGFSEKEWETIMKSPVKSHKDYKTLLPLIRMMKFPIRIAAKFKVVPEILYLKYAR